MSKRHHVAEHRKYRKAVGADALELMRAQAVILDERVFPVQLLQSNTLQDLTQRLVELERQVKALTTPAAPQPQQPTGAEVI